MADTATAIVVLTSGTVSGDIITTGAGGTSVTAGNTAVISAAGETRNLFITLFATSAATATLVAGDEPPSELSGLGSGGAQAVPAGDAVVVTLPAGRFVQDDGTVRIDIATNTVIVTPFRMGDV